jgi:hypothetical protein
MTRHVAVPEVNIDYIKCIVQGWDVDPATIKVAEDRRAFPGSLHRT